MASDYPGGGAGEHNDMLRLLRTTLEAVGLLGSNKVRLEDDFTGAALDAVRWTEEAAVGAGIAGAFDAPNNFYQVEGTAVGGAASDSVKTASTFDYQQPTLIRWRQRLSGTPAAGGAIRFYLELDDGTILVKVGARKIQGGADDILYHKNGAAAEVALDATDNTAPHNYMVLYLPTAQSGFQNVLLFVDGVLKGSLTATFTANLTLRFVGAASAAADLMTADQNYVTNVVVANYDPTMLSDILAGIGGTTGTAEAGTTTTLDDTHLTQANDYWNGQALVMRTGNNAGLSRRIVDFDAATDRLTVDPAFPGVIAAGDQYTIKDPTNAPTADSIVDTTMEAGIGNKTDAAVYAIGVAASLLGYLKGVLGKVGAAYVNAGGNPDVDTLRAHIRAGVLNGAGTAVPANKGLYDLLGAGYLAGGGASTVDSIRVHLLNGVLQAGGTGLPAAKALYDILGVAYVGAGGNPDVDTIRTHLRAGLLNGTGTAVAANKGLVDAIGHTGAASLATGIDADTQYLSRVDPGAGVAGSLTARIGQVADVAVDPDGGAGGLHAKVAGLGARVGDVADTQAQSTILGRLAVPTADVATNVHERDVVGNKADAAVAAPSATASIIAYLKGILNSVGTGVTGTADAGSDTDTMVDAARTEAAADYWVGALLVMESGNNAGLARIVVDFDPATDALQVAPAFPNAIAVGDSYNLIPRDAFPALTVGLNATGVAPATNSVADQLFIAAGEQLRTFVAKTGGTPIAATKSLVNAIGHTGAASLATGIDADTQYLYRVALAAPAANSIGANLFIGAAEPLFAFIAKSGGTAVPGGKSLYDLMGTGYLGAAGGDTVDSERTHLLAGLMRAGGTGLPAAKALYDLLGTGYLGAAGGDTVDSVRTHLLAGLQRAGGTGLPAAKSLVDLLGVAYVAAGGNPDVDTVRAHLRGGLLNGTGTLVAANKSLADAIGHTGAAALGTGLEAEIATVDTVVDAIKVQTDLAAGAETVATFSYLDAGGEQTILEVVITKRTKIHAFWIDTTTLTQNHTLRVYAKVDGVNYVPIFHRQAAYSSANGDIAIDMVNNNALAGTFVVDTDVKFTMQEGADEGAARSVPYRLIREQMEP